MKLKKPKTLKDLKGLPFILIPGGGKAIYSEELIAEAVKNIKAGMNRLDEFCNITDDDLDAKEDKQETEDKE